MSQHTPGPWVVHHDADCKEIEITAEDGRTIAFMFGNQPQDVADANLIAAAPDLLAACEGFLSVYTGCSCCFGSPGHRCNPCFTRAAVARAKGEACEGFLSVYAGCSCCFGSPGHRCNPCFTRAAVARAKGEA
jgi:hypothetical protein